MKLLSTTVALAALAAIATPAFAQVAAPSAAPPVEAAPPSSTTTDAAPPSSSSATTGKHDQAATGQAFMAADKDKSGALTMAEVKSANAGATQADFTKYDSNKDRQLSMAEFGKWTSDLHASSTSPG